METRDTGRLKVTNFVVAALVLAVSVMMFLPFWHYNDTSSSINGYVWMPSDQTGLEAYLSDELGYKVDINQVVCTQAFMFPLGYVGLVLCLIKADKAWSMIATIPFGVLGIIGYLSCEALQLGSAWWVLLALCIAIIVVDVVGLIASKPQKVK